MLFFFGSDIRCEAGFLALAAQRNPVHILRPKIEKLAFQAQGMSIFAEGEYLGVQHPSWVLFQLNPPSAGEIHLRWMKSLRDEICLAAGEECSF